MRPLESAATPGEDRVISELNSEEELSSGSLENSCRSTSVWNVGSFSSKSDASPSTVTLSAVPAIWTVIFRASGTAE